MAKVWHLVTGPLDGWLGAAAELVVPLVCAGCGRHGARWCTECEDEAALARPEPFCLQEVSGTVTAAATELSAPVGRAIVSWKDGDRLDLVPLLGDAARSALHAALAIEETRGGPLGPVLVVPVPSTRRAVRRRGGRPLHAVAERSTAAPIGSGGGLAWASALHWRRQVDDQRVLGRAQRAANVHGAMVVPARWEAPLGFFGAVAVLDDVHTTGATVGEAVRALRSAGVRRVCAAVVAAVP